MKDHERKALLERASRESGFVGAEIPRELEVDGDTIPLHEYVLETRTGDKPSDVDEVVKKLRRKRSNLRQSLEQEEMTYEEGVRHVDLITGIDRALTVLAGGSDDLDGEAKKKEKMDQQRWLEFLKKVTGRGGGDRR